MTKYRNISEQRDEKRIADGRQRISSEGEIEKCCSQCGDYWPADMEFFTARNAKDLRGYCRSCEAEMKTRYKQKAELKGVTP